MISDNLKWVGALLNALILLVFLFGTWVLLSGFLTSFFLGLGFLSAVTVTLVTMRVNRDVLPVRHLLRLICNSVIYVLWLFKEIIISGLQVSKIVWDLSGDLAISPKLAWINASQPTEEGLTVFASSITLTPGTVSVVVSPGRIQIHALEESSVVALQEGVMDKTVTRLFEEKMETAS